MTPPPAPAPAPAPAPYGSWHSPVTAVSLTAGTVTLSEPRIDGSDYYWLEGRASEGGRVVVVRRTPDGVTEDVTAPPFNARSRVHEYGGGAYDVDGGVLVFCSFDDRRVYRVDIDPTSRSGASTGAADPQPITPAGSLRYGDLRLDSANRAVFAVCEDHGGDGEPANRLVRLDLDGANEDGGAVLVEGHDFFSSPTPRPDGGWLAWVQWDHPDMPWDGTELCVAEVSEDGALSGERVVAGGRRESVQQPVWAPDGRLVFLSDRTGWCNLYAADVRDPAGDPLALWPAEHEFAGPHWMLGMSSYAISESGSLLCSWLDDGYARLGMVNLGTGECVSVDSDVTTVDSVCVGGGTGLLTVGYADRPAALIRLDLTSPDQPHVLRRSATAELDPQLVSRAEPVTWPGHGDADVHGFYYAPRNPAHTGPDGELPPLIVMSHGGPTGMSRPPFDPGYQYWTSRGFAVLDVNYGGSSGYGREYRERLRGLWGVVDVDDCTSGALAMAGTRRADPHRLAIRGGSAGGYTTLAALTFRDVFHAGASLFGVADLEALALETHKFESRYLDGLVGPYPAARDVYVERSPVHHVDRLSCPLILLQGVEDRVVPPGQAETMAAALRARGLPVAMLLFEGEGHGFRKAETVIRAFEAEAYFYSRVFGFDLADEVEPVEIENLPTAHTG